MSSRQLSEDVSVARLSTRWLTKHIFVGSKAPWFEISDKLPQFEGHAPSWLAVKPVMIVRVSCVPANGGSSAA